MSFKNIILSVLEVLGDRLANSVTYNDGSKVFRFNKKKANTHPVVAKLKEKEEVTLTELNLLLSDLYNKQSLKGYTFKLQENLIKDSIFKIDEIRLIEDNDGNIEGVSFILTEETYGLSLTISSNLLDFDEAFNFFEINLPKVEEK